MAKTKVKKILPKSGKVSRSIIVNSALYSFLVPFKPAQSQWLIKYIVILFALIIRVVVSFGDYSGKGSPPMYGDFEAQRHWLDLTVNAPVAQWYWYKLPYWGLDYPPLTAYHSLVLGYLGKWIRPNWFLLDATDGLESEDLKLFMRFTVLLSESFLYIPAVYYYTRWFNKNIDILDKKSAINQTLSIAIILFQPALILIDHGHFQYNSVMLGFALGAIVWFLYDHVLLGCVFFVFSLTFKQMALYYAPLVFAYLLGLTFNPFNELLYKLGIFKTARPNRYDFLNLTLIGVFTLASFVAVFFPIYWYADNGLLNVQQAVHRIFPFNRGIFEDKVANFWCATNTIVKYKRFPLSVMKLLALGCTLLSILPSCIIIYLYPAKQLIPWAMASCSWGFYLFSFQVHEKSVLLPLLPTSLLFCYINDNELFKIVSWINTIAVFSLGPLLKKDNLALQYYAVYGLCNWLVGNLTWQVLVNSIKLLFKNFFSFSWLANITIFASVIAAVGLDILPYYIEAPANLPDLWLVANITLSFACFALFYAWVTYKTWKVAVSIK